MTRSLFITPLLSFSLIALLLPTIGHADLIIPEAKPTPEVTKKASEAKTTELKDLIGYWEASFQGQTVTIEFKADSQAMLGDNGSARQATYTVDLSVTPHQLTFMMGTEPGKTIFEITEEGLRLAKPDDKTRPTAFGPDSLVFKRATKPTPAPAPAKREIEEPQDGSAPAGK